MWTCFPWVRQSRCQPQNTMTLSLVPKWVLGAFSRRRYRLDLSLDLRDRELSQGLEMGLLLHCLGKVHHVLLFLFFSNGNAMFIYTVNCEDEWDMVWQIVSFQKGVNQREIAWKTELLMTMSPPPAFTKSIFCLKNTESSCVLLWHLLVGLQFLLEPLNLTREGISSVQIALWAYSNGDTVALDCNMNCYEGWVKGQASCLIQGCFSLCRIFGIRVSHSFGGKRGSHHFIWQGKLIKNWKISV